MKEGRKKGRSMYVCSCMYYCKTEHVTVGLLGVFLYMLDFSGPPPFLLKSLWKDMNKYEYVFVYVFISIHRTFAKSPLPQISESVID